MAPQLLLPIIDALADGRWHSGETLAKKIGITRAALSKRVQALAGWGLQVESRTRVGYRLAQPLDLLDEARIRKHLSALAAARLQRIEVKPLTDSTNAQLLDAPAQKDPQALLAEFQSAGRGRRGREWISPFGANLVLSLAWSFDGWPAQLTALSLAVGVACARALPELKNLQLKWPNDLVHDGKKLGGILIEQRGEAGGVCRTIIGVGLNVAMQAKQGRRITQGWTSLQTSDAIISRNALAAALLSRLVEALLAFEQNGFAPFADEWRQRDLTLDKKIQISSAGETLNGIARGVDGDGALLLEIRGKIQRVLSGDVSLRLS